MTTATALTREEWELCNQKLPQLMQAGVHSWNLLHKNLLLFKKEHPAYSAQTSLGFSSNYSSTGNQGHTINRAIAAYITARQLNIELITEITNETASGTLNIPNISLEELTELALFMSILFADTGIQPEEAHPSEL